MVNNETNSSIYHDDLLDELPLVDTCLGMLDLRTGALIIAAVCVVHPLVYGCTLFMPMSYLLLTIWLLLGLFFVASILLFWALTENDTEIMSLWIWYSMLFISSMVLLLLVLSLLYASKKQWARVAIVLLGVLWYLLTAYFVIVINSHRQAVIKHHETHNVTKQESSDVSKNPDLTNPTEPNVIPTEPNEIPTEPNDAATTTVNDLLRKAFDTTGRSWYRRREISESVSERPLLEFDCSSLAPGNRQTRGQGLSPEVNFSQDGNTIQTVL